MTLSIYGPLKIYTAKSRQQPSKIEIHWTLPAATMSQEDSNDCRRTIPPSLSLYSSVHPLVLRTLGAASTGLSSALDRYTDPHLRLPKASPKASPKPVQSQFKPSPKQVQTEAKSEEAGKKTSQRQESCPLSNGLAAICGSSLFVSFQRISIQGMGS
jgi:hypothetical protein